MRYKLVGDPDELIKFVDTLPELQENELYFMALFVRKKYMPKRKLELDECSEIPSSIQLWRSGLKKEHIVKSVYQVQQRMSGFSHGGLRIPPEAFVLYIHPNPRDNRLASGRMALEINKRILHGHPMPHIQSEAKTFLQKSKSRSYFAHFDYDNVDESYVCFIDGDIDDKKIDEMVTNGASIILNNINALTQAYKTRAGIHILMHVNGSNELVERGILDKMWYKSLKELPECDEHGDFMIPIPGTFQGGDHIVRLIKP